MKIKCDYCGNYLSDTEEKCPSCMAPNAHLKRVGNEVPQTIEELKNWYQEHNLPPEETTRFFIGKNYQAPRAFGIYYDEKKGNYVVYKNKDTGERAIRYEGKDESYAVNELYLKLKEEILHQKSLNTNRNNSNYERDKAKRDRRFRMSMLFAVLFPLLIVLATFIQVGIVLFTMTTGRSYGYYEYQNEPYYLQSYCYIRDGDCEWYHYDTKTDSWSVAGNFPQKKANYVGREWNNYEGIEIKNELQDADFYKEIHPPEPEKGYYTVDGKTYYYYHGWYVYNNNDWSHSDEPNHDVKINPDNYYDQTRTYDDPYEFEDTSYYSNYYVSNSSDYDSSWSSSSNDSSWDSGSSWDSSDSWDSGSTDWGSDW